MTFFESLLILVAVAICLVQISRRLSIPYPTMLAASGAILALVPGAPVIALDPPTALALFIAPALCEAAFEFPVNAVWRLWRPLFSFAVIAVLLSTAALAWLGVHVAGLPVFAAVALGAIVAPPDAAAATAILRTVRMPRRSVAILKGESLLNDATSLLLFTAAVAFQTQSSLDGTLVVQLGLAAPGGLLLGLALARSLQLLLPLFAGTLSSCLLEYLFCFGAWIVADHLHLSAVLCVVAFAMTIARADNSMWSPRMRLHNSAFSLTSVFLLNVLAFLLMGFQARAIVSHMTPERLREASEFAGLVVACLIVVRMVWALVYNRLAHRFRSLRGDFEPSTLRHGILIGWCGMRGLVTLVAALALPADFSQRDLITLSAFAVVLGTLVVQGLTVTPLVRMLGLDGEDGLANELAQSRTSLAAAALAALGSEAGPFAAHWRLTFETIRSAIEPEGDLHSLAERRRLGLLAIRGQRERLHHLSAAQWLGSDTFTLLQEELDFAEIALANECEPRILES